MSGAELQLSRDWDKPGCRGCVYAGKDIPCEYILIVGHSPQRDGAHIDPEGKGGCELYLAGARERAKRPALPPGPGKPGRPKKAKKAEEPGEKRGHVRRVDPGRCLALYYEGMSDRTIAETLRISVWSVRRWRQERNLPPHIPRGGAYAVAPDGKKKLRESPLNDPAVLAAWKAGATDGEIAEMAGTTREAAAKWRKRNGLTCNREIGGG